MKQTTVLLIDHSVAGHKYAFAKLFAKYLLKLDFEVILVLPEKTETIHRELTDELGHLTQYLHTYNISYRAKKYAVNKLIDEALNAFSNWLSVRKAVNNLIKKQGHKIDLVFFCWLDTYLANYLPHQFIDVIFPWKWCGLYFHPWYLFQTESLKVSLSSKDNVLLSKNCIGVGVHDDLLATKLSSRIRKPVLYFPEFADASPPFQEHELSSTIIEKAKSKPIVGLIGLAKRKGLLHLLDVIEIDKDKEFFYFLGGDFPTSDYTSSEAERVRYFLDNLPGNILHYPSSIPEGHEINSVISTWDVVFLVYDNFKSSSNFLTKAALLKKLVVGIDSYWIGDNINKYHLGYSVSGLKASETFEKIKLLVPTPEGMKPNWDGFLDINGEEKLASVFRELLGSGELRET